MLFCNYRLKILVCFALQIPLEALDAAARFGVVIEPMPVPNALPDGATLALPDCISVSVSVWFAVLHKVGSLRFVRYTVMLRPITD